MLPVALLGVGLLSLCLRLPALTESLWVDELHTAWSIGGSWSEISKRAMQGNNHPLFFYITRCCTTVLGYNEFGLRFPALLAGTLLASIVTWIVTRWTKNLWAGVLAGVLIAIDRDQIFFATEARSYAAAQLIGVLQIYFLVELILHRTISKMITCVLLTSLMIYLHYTTGLILVAECLAVVVCCCMTKKFQSLYDATLMMGCSLVLCLPVMSHLLEVHARKENWASFVKVNSVTEIFTILPMWLLLLVPAVLWCIDHLYRRLVAADKEERSTSGSDLSMRFLFVSAAVMLPVILAWVLTYQGWLHLFMNRYLIVSLGGLFLLAGLIFGMIRKGVLVTSMFVCLGLPFVLSTISGSLYDHRLPHDLYRMRYEDWRSTVQLLNREEPYQSGPILLKSGLIESDGLRQSSEPSLVNYSLLPLTSAYPLNFDAHLIPLAYRNAGKLEPWQLQKLGNSKRFTIVVRGRVHPVTGADPCNLVIQQLENSINQSRHKEMAAIHLKILLEENYPGVRVRLLERVED